MVTTGMSGAAGKLTSLRGAANAMIGRGGRGGRGGMKGGGMPAAHPGLTKDQKRQFTLEIKSDFREMVNQIAQHYADNTFSKIDTKLEQ